MTKSEAKLKARNNWRLRKSFAKEGEWNFPMAEMTIRAAWRFGRQASIHSRALTQATELVRTRIDLLRRADKGWLN